MSSKYPLPTPSSPNTPLAAHLSLLSPLSFSPLLSLSSLYLFPLISLSPPFTLYLSSYSLLCWPFSDAICHLAHILPLAISSGHLSIRLPSSYPQCFFIFSTLFSFSLVVFPLSPFNAFSFNCLGIFPRSLLLSLFSHSFTYISSSSKMHGTFGFLTSCFFPFYAANIFPTFGELCNLASNEKDKRAETEKKHQMRTNGHKGPLNKVGQSSEGSLTSRSSNPISSSPNGSSNPISSSPNGSSNPISSSPNGSSNPIATSISSPNGSSNPIATSISSSPNGSSISSFNSSPSKPFSTSHFFRIALRPSHPPLPFFLLLPMLLSSAFLSSPTSASHHRHEQHATCSLEGAICSTSNAHICRNGSCLSACSVRGMKECRCDTEEDNYCYLCCGNARDRCLPAHEQGILRDNGERWERESCTRCRMKEAEMEGMPCDDKDPQRLCLQGKCSKSVCADKVQGQYCDRREEKICVDDICENPCARIASHLMVCDCPAIDPDTGFASEDRCQLCCHDYNLKPASRRCQNAFRKYSLKSAQDRPIWRIGLDCAGGKRCNRYGICSNNATVGESRARVHAIIIVGIVAVVFMVAAVITTSETF